MLLAWMLTRVDPNEERQAAMSFVQAHPVLRDIAEFLNGEWPTTGVIPQGKGGGPDHDVPETGLLKRIGYSVGKTGASESQRREALKKAYEVSVEQYSEEYSEKYLSEWGEPETSNRLRKIAESVAAFCRSHRGQPGRETAIGHWESDLEWLRNQYYNPLSYAFEWPSTRRRDA
jgi:hypothetical protein